jgi:hypothetical protein
VEHFEDDDDNDNDSDDVEDVSVHGSWITRRYPRRQAILVGAGLSHVISVFPPRPAVPRIILNDLCERIGDILEKETTFPPFSLPCTRGQRNPSGAKISASAFRLKSKKTKRLATSTISIRKALNC